jgi:aryl-alcohol dehydrogenase-like predicted oxidoreductase
MDYVNLGRSGLKVSRVCLGCMTFDREADVKQSFAIMDYAWEQGINFFDTANMYNNGRSEVCVGRWIAERDVRRELVLATKCASKMGDAPNEAGLSRRTILSHCEDSLRRLGTDWIDLYQCHFWDPATPIDETLAAFDQLVREGKVRYIGASNFAAWQIMKALAASERHDLSRFISVQPMYNLCKRAWSEDEIFPLCADQGLGVIPYNPLAGGFLTGKYTRDAIPKDSRLGNFEMYHNRFISPRNFDILDRFLTEAKRRGVTPAQLALAWVAAHPVVTAPIVGARNVDQLKDSLQGLDIKLSDDDRQSIAKLAEFEWEGNLGR